VAHAQNPPAEQFYSTFAAKFSITKLICSASSHISGFNHEAKLVMDYSLADLHPPHSAKFND
jgi:hypothetical protein